MADEYTEVFDTILQDTIPELPGALRAVAKRELRLACREFFEKSYAWVENVDAIAVSSGVTPIQIDDGDANTEIIGILHLEMGNDTDGYRDLTPLPDRPSRGETSNHQLFWYTTSNPDEFVVYPYPTDVPTDVVRAKVALIPAFDTEELPRQITLKYYDTIVNGFLARMLAHPNKPYSQAGAAATKRGSFVKAMGFYAAQRKQGYNGAPRWRFPRGWNIPKVR